jgi:hypothetical protein
MIDLFSKNIRRFIPAKEYFELQRNASVFSLTQQRNMDIDVIEKRIAELDLLEETSGFVYFGEKQWLRSLRERSSFQAYSIWAKEQLTTILSCELDTVDVEIEEVCWQGYTEDLSCVVCFSELTDPILTIDCLNVSILGDGISPNPKEWLLVFEVLHNLCYFLFLTALRLRDAEGSCSASVERIVIKDGSDWSLFLLTEYGGDSEAKFHQQEMMLW